MSPVDLRSDLRSVPSMRVFAETGSVGATYGGLSGSSGQPRNLPSTLTGSRCPSLKPLPNSWTARRWRALGRIPSNHHNKVMAFVPSLQAISTHDMPDASLQSSLYLSAPARGISVPARGNRILERGDT